MSAASTSLAPIVRSLSTGRPVTGPPNVKVAMTSIAVLESGQGLVMFPEGTRQGGPVVQELFDGSAYVAAKTQVPIVPVGIGGSEKAMPKGAKFIHPAKIVVVIGEPLDPPAPSEGGRTPRRAVKELTDQLHAEIQKLFDDARTRAS